MTDGFHDYGTAPCAPHRPAPKQEDGTMADVQREQLARLQRLGADPGIASVLLDEHGADTLVALPDDALEALADGKRAADSVDMSTIDSVLGWVYENEDDAVSTVARAQLALTLEEARRKPRRGVLDPLRAYVEDNVETPQPTQTVTAGAEITHDDGSHEVVTTSEPAGEQPAALDLDVAGSTIEEVLAAVGDDPQRARAAIEQEQTRTQGSPRPRLLDKLTALTGE
jgi:hypothetical protein